jgi:hypothetical protein
MAEPYHTLDRASLDRLESLYAAYLGLQVLSGSAQSVDSVCVASVLDVLNESLSRCVSDLSPKPAGLRLVKDD